MMIGEINLAYPYARFTTRVSYFTARDSTAIEWMILEAIDRCSSFPEYGNWPVGTLFREIFTIADPNLIILPCLLVLQDLDAITAEDISDETNLDDMYMRNLRLTEKGAGMRHTGKLPGAMNEDLFQVDYDPLTERLISAPAGGKADVPDGIRVLEIESPENIRFPAPQVQNMLDLRGGKNIPKGMVASPGCWPPPELTASIRPAPLYFGVL